MPEGFVVSRRRTMRRLLARWAGERKTPPMFTFFSRITSVTLASWPGSFWTSTSTQLPRSRAPTSSIRVLIMSEEVMMPTRPPSATTGRQPILRSFSSRAAWSMVSSGWMVASPVVMMSPSLLQLSASRSPVEPRGGLVSLRSLSETIPTRRPSSTTGRCLMFLSRHILHASAALASGPKVTTSRVMASLTRSILPVLSSRPSRLFGSLPEAAPPAGSAPDVLGRLHYGPELALLVLDAKGVAHDGGREAALGAKGEALERHVTGGLPEPCLELPRRLLPARFGGDQAEDGDLVLGDVCERLEGAAPLVVVLEHEPVGVDVGEEVAGERLVGAGDEPAAPLVAPAQVEGESDAGVVPYHVVVELDAAGHPAVEGPAPLLVEGAGLRVKQERVVRGVELDILGAEADQLVHLLAQDLRHVLKEEVERRVRLLRELRRPQVRVHARARERYLHHPLRPRPGVDELLDREVAAPAELAHDAELGRAIRLLVPDGLVAVPVAPQPGVDGVAREALHGLHQLALEGLAAHLAVGHDGQAGPLLERDRPVHRPVFDPLELGRRKLPGRVMPAGIQQPGGPEKAPHHVRAQGPGRHGRQSSTGPRGGLADALHHFAVSGDEVDDVGDDPVVAGAAGDHVGLRGEAGRTGPEARDRDDVVATLARELVSARVVEDKVVARPPEDLVVPWIAPEGVVARPAPQDVVAGTVDEGVVACLPPQDVGPAPAVQDAPAVTAEERVGAVGARQAVGVRRALEDRRERGPAESEQARCQRGKKDHTPHLAPPRRRNTLCHRDSTQRTAGPLARTGLGGSLPRDPRRRPSCLADS